jgi:UDP-N-acetylglucosamine acyltransferase
MISQLAYVDPAAKLGKDVIVHPFAFIDKDVEIGDKCEIMPYASIMKGTRMGSGVKVYQGAIVAADPQDFRWKGEQTYCYIGNNTIIREQVIINRGIKPEGGTRIGDDCFILAESHIGHDSYIHSKCVVGNGATIAGDVDVQSGTILSSNVVLHENVHVGKFALIKGGCRISSNVPPFVIIAHNPATYYGVNAIILGRHAGFSEEQIDDIAKAYRHIYQSPTSLFNALLRIEGDIEQSEHRDAILSFIRDNSMHIVGARSLD